MRKSDGKRLHFTKIDGKLVKIGDTLPVPVEKLKVRPKSFADDPRRGPKGVFTNGRS